MYQKGNKDKELEIIKLYLGDYSKRFYLREISKLSKMPLKTTQRILKNLENKKILKAELDGKNKYFSLNIDNIETKSFILQAEIQKTLDFIKKYPSFKLFLKDIRTQQPLIIFGSFAKFLANKNSDIDILIITDKKQELPFHLLPNKIHKIIISEKNFIESFKKQETLIKKIQESHIILNNYTFLVNLMWDKYGR